MPSSVIALIACKLQRCQATRTRDQQTPSSQTAFRKRSLDHSLPICCTSNSLTFSLGKLSKNKAFTTLYNSSGVKLLLNRRRKGRANVRCPWGDSR